MDLQKTNAYSKSSEYDRTVCESQNKHICIKRDSIFKVSNIWNKYDYSNFINLAHHSINNHQASRQ